MKRDHVRRLLKLENTHCPMEPIEEKMNYRNDCMEMAWKFLRMAMSEFVQNRFHQGRRFEYFREILAAELFCIVPEASLYLQKAKKILLDAKSKPSTVVSVLSSI